MSEERVVETDNARGKEQRLASALALEENAQLPQTVCPKYKNERARLQQEVEERRQQLAIAIKTATPVVQPITGAPVSVQNAISSDTEQSGQHEYQPLPIDNDSEGGDDISIYSDQTGSHDVLSPPSFRLLDRHIQPRGFKTLYARVGKFSGQRGDDDFEVWAEDFIEATTDCGWNNDDRARWFSWFITAWPHKVHMATKFETSRQGLMGEDSKHLLWPVWGTLRPEDSLPTLPRVTIPPIWLSPRTNECYEGLPEDGTPEIER